MKSLCLMQSDITNIPKQKSLKKKRTLKEGIDSKMLFKDVCKDFLQLQYLVIRKHKKGITWLKAVQDL